MNAHDFVKQQAEILKAAGNTVNMEDTEDRIIVQAKNPGSFGNIITLSAYKSAHTGRWNLMPGRVYRIFGKTIQRKTYSRIRTMVDTYGGAWRTTQAS